MRCKFSFSQSDDGRLLVLTEWLDSAQPSAGITITAFKDENVFLYSVVLAEFSEGITTSLIANVLLTLSERAHLVGWTSLDATERQLRSLGVALPSSGPSTAAPAAPIAEPFAAPISLLQLPRLFTSTELRDVLLQAPMPIAMLVGPQHVFAFANPAYVRLIGRLSAETVVGKPVRDVLPELEIQGFVRLLNKVYVTGEPHVGREVRVELRLDKVGPVGEFFDFVYHPVRSAHGEVCGILCQVSDATERVLARQVSEARELQLYRQWAELEAIYKAAPVAMALVDCKEHRFLRVNDMHAELLNLPAADLVGRCVFDLFPEQTTLRAIYRRVSAGEEVRNVQFDLFSAGPDAQPRRLLLNFTPVRDACGYVEAIASIVIDRTERIRPDTMLVMSFEPAQPTAP